MKFHRLNHHIKPLVEIKKTERLWHFPFLAGISGMRIDVNALMEARLLDTVIGSLIGVAAGWVLHNNLLVSNLEKQIRSLKLLILRK